MKTAVRNLLLALALLVGVNRAAAQATFAPAVTYGIGYYPYCIVAADVNGDGKPDLICINGLITVLTNNGSGGFVFASSPAVGPSQYPFRVAAADINGDGKPDLITANANTPGTLSVLTNSGGGGFVLTATLNVGNHPYSVAAFTNVNGKVDIACVNEGSASLEVLTNNGSGNFVSNATLVVAGSSPWYVVAADINGDGKVDLISANVNNSTLAVFTNNGSGNFVLASTSGVGNGPQSFAAADVNGDGKIDLITGNNNDNTVTVLTNSGNGGFGRTDYSLSGNEPMSVAIADVNGDGRPDIICADYAYSSGTLFVLTNSGGGVFGSNTIVTVGNGPYSVTAADVNNDGKLDLISANQNQGSGNLSVLFNTSPSPLLGITSVSNQAVLVWPALYGNYILQSTTNLVSPSVWSTNFPSPVILNGKNIVTNPITRKQQFFRLIAN
jgi:hypothetical protein